MLSIIFLVSSCVIAASILRRPQQRWQWAATLLAVIMLLAVCVAWTLEYVLTS